MSRSGEADLHLTVYPTQQYILHKQSVDVFHDAFVQQLAIGDTSADIGKRLVVVDDLVDFPKLLAANGNPILQQRLGLNQGKGISFDGGGVVSIFHIEAALEAFQRRLWKTVINLSQLLFLLDYTAILHATHLFFSIHSIP